MSKIEFQQLTELFQETHERLGQIAARSINTSLVVRNWLYGWYIVEFENAAAERSELYGKSLLQNLAEALADSGIKGISLTNLRKFRQFYKVCQPTPEIKHELAVLSATGSLQKIRQTLSVESFPILSSNTNSLAVTANIYPLLTEQFHLS